MLIALWAWALVQAPGATGRLIENYRQYPDRYIRILDESWKLDPAGTTATHSFTLKNTAGVAYSDVTLRIAYQNSAGKDLQVQSLKIPGILKAYEIKKIKDFKVKNVPEKSDQAVISIAKALIHS